MINKKKDNLGFWSAFVPSNSGLRRDKKKLKKPIMCLAPMSDVTDEAFRQMFVKYGKPDVLWTEFVSAAGLCSRGCKNILTDLKFKTNERPIVAQIFGANPEHFFKSAQILAKLDFDGIDINMGCPDRKVEKQSAGAALIKNPKLAQEIIRETKRGSGRMPVSVKTRIGYNKIETTKWIKALLEAEPAAISIHWRTRKEMSEVPAHWPEAKKVMKLAKNTGTLIIGNGDAISLEDAYAKAKKYGVDGVMVGRGVFGRPWFFNPMTQNVSVEKRLKIMAEHAALFEKLFRNIKSFNVMKKHFKAYAAGFEGAKELRVKLMKAENVSEVRRIVKEFSKNF